MNPKQARLIKVFFCLFAVITTTVLVSIYIKRTDTLNHFFKPRAARKSYPTVATGEWGWIRQGWTVDSFSDPQMKEIYTAIESHDLAKVSGLLENGVSPNITAEDGTTPLLLAFRYDEPIFRLLLKSGANPGVPIHVKFPTAGILEPGESVLTLAAATDAPWFEILTEFPMDVNHRGYRGNTVTHRLIRAMALPPVKMARMEWIVKHGADLSLKNDFNETPLIMALHDGPIMVNFLIDAGGTPADKKEFERIIRFYQEQEPRLEPMYASVLKNLHKAYRAKYGTDYVP